MQSKFAMNSLSCLSAFSWVYAHRSLLQVLIMILLAACSNQNGGAADPIPEKLVVLTFDDSAKSHFTVVRPLLLNYGFSATFFITEGFLIAVSF